MSIAHFVLLSVPVCQYSEHLQLTKVTYAFMSHKIHLELQVYTNLNCPVKATLTDLRHQGHYSRDKKGKIKKNSFRCWITEMLSHIPRHLLRKALNTFRFFGDLTAYPFWDLTVYPCAFSICTLFIKTKEVEVQRNI